MQNGEQQNELSNNYDDFRNNEPFYARVKRVLDENPNISDHDLRSKMRDLMPEKSQSLSYSDTDHVFPFCRFRSPFSDPFFTRCVNRFDKWQDEIDRHFDVDTTAAEPEQSSSSSYMKCVSSMTSIQDGYRKSKSISEVQRVKDGKRHVHKKITTNDENGTTVEEVFPDGTKRKTISDKTKNANVLTDQ